MQSSVVVVVSIEGCEGVGGATHDERDIRFGAYPHDSRDARRENIDAAPRQVCEERCAGQHDQRGG